MPYDPLVHHRRSIRLNGVDYAAAGGYFITICSYQKRWIFGEVIDGEMHLSKYGQIVSEEYLRSFEIRNELQTDSWVIMPNHMHCIVWIIETDHDDEGKGEEPLAPTNVSQLTHAAGYPSKSVGSFVAGFKLSTTKRINQIRNTPGIRVWQRNYYERILRKEDDLHRIQYYIETNPGYWQRDPNYAYLE